MINKNLKEFVCEYIECETEFPPEMLARMHACEKKAFDRMDKKYTQIISENHFFHDAYVSKIAFEPRGMRMVMLLSLFMHDTAFHLAFDDISYMHVSCELFTDKFLYPWHKRYPSIAQLLGFFLDYNNDMFECAILLDNEKYLIFGFREFALDEQSLSSLK